MRRALLLALGLASCRGEETRQAVPEPSGPPVAQQVGAPKEPPPRRELAWNVTVSGADVALHLLAPDATPVMALTCSAGRLRAQVPGFTPVGSEDRLTLGVGEEPVALVAQLDARASGVVGEAPVPEGLERLFEQAESVSAVYGRQQSGPHPAPPEALKEQLVEACEPK